MSRVALVTFAGNPEGEGGKYAEIQHAATRLQQQALATGSFCSTTILTWDSIYRFAYANDIPMPIHPNKYLFTPLLAKMAITGCFGDFDIIFYAGAGCEISQNFFAKSDFKRMVHEAELNGIYVEGTRYKDISWCTNELVKKLSPSEGHLNSGQVQATFFLLSNVSTNAFKVGLLVEEWVRVATEQEGVLIGDDFTPSEQSSLFIAPRNDQSILSLLVKKYGFKIFREKRRGFGSFLFSIRGSNTFLFSSRNRTGVSRLPKNINNPIIGFLTMTIRPLLVFHDLISDSLTKRKQYSQFPAWSIATKSTWPR